MACKEQGTSLCDICTKECPFSGKKYKGPKKVTSETIPTSIEREGKEVAEALASGSRIPASE